MSAVIINIGSELLSGDVINKNFLFLTQKLQEEGIDIVAQIIVGDEREHLTRILKDSLSHYSQIFVTGGLGATEDDITREAISSSVNKPLVLDKKLLKEIKSRYEKWGKRFLPVHERMAKIPEGAIPVTNYVGAAPGFYLECEGRQIFALPGVPEEMRDMWGRIRTFLVREKNVIIRKRVLKCWGLSESEVNGKIKSFLEKDNPRLGITVNPYGVEIRIKAKGGSPRQAEEILEKVERNIKDTIGDNIYAADTTDMEKVVGMLLTLKKKSISLAESCTGGLISHRLTNVPGSSQYFTGGIIVYSNKSKIEKLGVDPEILEKYGAVSKETAREMAVRIREKMGTDLGIAVTGIAGPAGGTREKPVGLVYTALSEANNCWVEEHRFIGERISIKIKSSQAALDLVRRYLLELLKK
ncbi:MAG: competence/damage-inducible protein A [Caldiserica bacterium]|nr:competence/damage-inducible protein A [Caldisericota bacterium]